MKKWVLAAFVTAFGSLFIGKTISNTGYMGNGYYGTIEIQILILLGTVICCTGLIINTIKQNQ